MSRRPRRLWEHKTAGKKACAHRALPAEPSPEGILLAQTPVAPPPGRPDVAAHLCLAIRNCV
jgi:hypothetical protein